MLHCQAAKAEALKGIANKKEREREGERERRKKKSDKERGISQQEGRARDVCVVSNICMFASNEILILLFG